MTMYISLEFVAGVCALYLAGRFLLWCIYLMDSIRKGTTYKEPTHSHQSDAYDHSCALCRANVELRLQVERCTDGLRG
jgi:hypothetical protein